MRDDLFKLEEISKERYEEISSTLISYLDDKFGLKYRIPRFYHEKAYFYNMDIILSTTVLDDRGFEALKSTIVKDLNITDYYSNGTLFSVVFMDFQLDFLLQEEENFISTYHFMSFNDLGSFIGRICRKFNLKYGGRGLDYVYRRADGHYRRDIPLTKDFTKIFTFLGLDMEKWKAGFTDEKDMFAWVVNCPYFSVSPYEKLMGNLIKKSLQRKILQDFVQYLGQNNISKVYKYDDNKDLYLPAIDRFFSEARLSEEIANERRKESHVMEVRKKYHGQLVMDLIPGLEGRLLGRFMQAFQNQFDDHESVLFNAAPEEIAQMILKFKENYYSENRH